MPEKFRKVLVFGGGISGKGAYAALEKKGINCVLRTESDYADDKNNYDAVVVSPGVKPDHPIFKRYAGKIISEIDLGAILRRNRILPLPEPTEKPQRSNLPGGFCPQSTKRALLGISADRSLSIRFRTAMRLLSKRRVFNFAIQNTSLRTLRRYSISRPITSIITAIRTHTLRLN